MPTKTIAPTPRPAAGQGDQAQVAPLIPAASMMRKAPSNGDPSSVLTAAKLLGEAMIVRAIGVCLLREGYCECCEAAA